MQFQEAPSSPDLPQSPPLPDDDEDLPLPPAVPNGRQALFASIDPHDFDQVVRTVWGEARGEPPLGQQAVAHVIANCAEQSGMSPAEVVKARGQFEPWSARRRKLEALDPELPRRRNH